MDQPIMSRFSWTHVRAALDNIYDCASYYIGGTLCIDLAQGYSVCLNRNGRGFTFIVGGPEVTFLMPKDLQTQVGNLYKEIKRR